MDREKLRSIYEMAKDILANEPTDEDLDYDETKIEIYANLHNFVEAMEYAGY